MGGTLATRVRRRARGRRLSTHQESQQREGEASHQSEAARDASTRASRRWRRRARLKRLTQIYNDATHPYPRTLFPLLGETLAFPPNCHSSPSRRPVPSQARSRALVVDRPVVPTRRRRWTVWASATWAKMWSLSISSTSLDSTAAAPSRNVLPVRDVVVGAAP